MDWLTGKVALVTGGGSGIGRAVVKRFIAEGAKVVAFDRVQDRLDEVKKEFKDKVAIYKGDVTSLADNRAAVALAVSTFGKLDSLIANAGIFDGGRNIRTISDAEVVQVFDQLYAVNVKGALYSVKAAVPELIKSKGNVVFTLSQAAFFAGGGGPIYCSSKSGMLGMMRELAYELAPDVRLNGVAPGGVLTNLESAPAVVSDRPQRSYEERAATYGQNPTNPMKVATWPDDLAGSYVFLASDQSSTMTGVTVHNDGGSNIRGMQFGQAQAAPGAGAPAAR